MAGYWIAQARSRCMRRFLLAPGVAGAWALSIWEVASPRDKPASLRY